MQNKFIFITLIILNLFIFNAYSDDQINFDVSEIEILDEGNRIIGKKRGTITTNDGIIIEADEFDFDKIKNILNAKGNIKIEDLNNDFSFFGQNIFYDKNIEKIFIDGKSEALVETSYKFQTDNITILRNEMVISSDVGGIIFDNVNQIRYEIGKFSYSLEDKILKGEKIFINTNTINLLVTNIFKSAAFNLKNDIIFIE